MAERDWATIVAALRTKADRADTDGSVTADEARMLRDKANDLERRYGPFDKAKIAAAIFADDVPWRTPEDPADRLARIRDEARDQRQVWLDSLIGEDFLYDDE